MTFGLTAGDARRCVASRQSVPDHFLPAWYFLVPQKRNPVSAGPSPASRPHELNAVSDEIAFR